MATENDVKNYHPTTNMFVEQQQHNSSKTTLTAGNRKHAGNGKSRGLLTCRNNIFTENINSHTIQLRSLGSFRENAGNMPWFKKHVYKTFQKETKSNSEVQD